MLDTTCGKMVNIVFDSYILKIFVKKLLSTVSLV